MLISDAITAATDRLHLEESKHTVRAYITGLNVFREFLISDFGYKDETDLSALTMKQFIRFPNYLIRNYRPATAVVYLAAADYFLKRILAKNRWISAEPIDMIDYEDEKKHMKRHDKAYEPREVAEKDIQKMIDAVKLIDDTEVRKARDVAIILFLASSGLRNFELCALKCRDITWNSTYDKPFVHVESGKGEKTADIPFGADAYKAIKEYWKVRGWSRPDEPAIARHDKGAGKKHKFTSTATIRNVVAEVHELAGIEAPFTPHYFRHGVATQIIRKTGNIELARKQLRHSNIGTTSGYAHLLKDDLVEGHNKTFGDDKV